MHSPKLVTTFLCFYAFVLFGGLSKFATIQGDSTNIRYFMRTVTEEIGNYSIEVNIGSYENADFCKKFVIDKNNGRVYVCCTRSIHQLSPKLDTEVKRIEKLPWDDTILQIRPCSVFVIEHKNRQLIACGGKNGFCNAYSLKNISIIVHEGVKSIVRDYNDIALTFVGPYLPPNSSAPLLSLYVWMFEVVLIKDHCLQDIQLHQVTIRNLQQNDYLTVIENVNLSDHQVNIAPFSIYSCNYFYYGEPFQHGYGFTYRNFGYLLNNDPSGIARLSRIGRSNQKLLWNHQPITCVNSILDITFNTALAAFMQNMQENDDVLYVMLTSGENWGICMYSMIEINHRIDNNIAIEQLASIEPAKREVFLSASTLTLMKLPPRSFLVTLINNYKIIYINYNTDVYKVIIREDFMVYNIILPKYVYYFRYLITDMALDYSKIYLYLYSREKIIKLRIPKYCNEYDNKDACLSTQDPYCGWCFASSKCCLTTECQQENNSIIWIPPDIHSCIISSEFPMKILPITNQHEITINLRNNLFLCNNHTITCLFKFNNTFILNTTAICTKNIINCLTPSSYLLPSININTPFITTQLLVMFNTFPKILQSGITVKFFDCNIYNSCTSCLDSGYECNWNINKYRCMPKQNIYSNNAFEIGNSHHCPRFYPIAGEPSYIYKFAQEEIGPIDQVNYETVMVGSSAPVGFSYKRSICSFQVENLTIIANATTSYARETDDMLYCIITCTVKKFKYISNTPNTTVEISISGEYGALDNVYNMQFVLYKCANMGDNCETCMGQVEEINCVWCQHRSTGSCQHENVCEKMYSHHSCEPKNPITLAFFPRSGPWEGGTVILIVLEGWNLTIYNVTVAGVDCQFTLSNNENYILASVQYDGVIHKLILVDGQPAYSYGKNYIYPIASDTNISHTYKMCKMQRNLSMVHSNKGPVVVHLPHTKVEDQNFEFVNPKIQDFSPRSGLQCGGTRVLIVGEYLSSGSQIQIFFDDLECVLLAMHSNGLICITSPSNQTIKSKLMVKFDGNNRTIEKPYFEYVGDMEPDDATREVPRGTPAGGIDILVLLDNGILSTQKIILNVIARKEKELKNFSSNCQIISQNRMICPSPVFSEDITSFYVLRKSEPAKLDYEFVGETQNLSIRRYQMFLLYPDSVKHIMLGVKKISLIEAIIIWLEENTTLLIITASAILLLFAVVTLLIIYRRNFQKMQRQINKMGIEAIAMSQFIKQVIVEKEIELDENDYHMLKLPNVSIVPTSVKRSTDGKQQEIEYKLPKDDFWEFPRHNLCLGKCVGQGEFGKVVKGEATSILKQDVVTTVAIKMLKKTHTDVDMICLVSELEMMKLIGRPGHKNVLRLLGCCTQGGPLLVITEYATNGNLLKFLHKHKLATNKFPRPGLLDEKILITFALQVAKGMEYLASMRCIHRDLAARNILVTENNTMKISDFGLAKDVHGKYYYQQGTNARVPVRWMAPEVLHHGRNTIKSDVWSYGILLWEMVTLGGVPYSSYLDVDKLLREIKSGTQMEKPEHCSIEIYEVMQKCWNYQPEGRPTFTDVVGCLEEMLRNEEVGDPATEPGEIISEYSNLQSS